MTDTAPAQLMADPRVKALVEASSILRYRFQTGMRGRTWTMTNMIAAKRFDAAIEFFEPAAAEFKEPSP